MQHLLLVWVGFTLFLMLYVLVKLKNQKKVTTSDRPKQSKMRHGLEVKWLSKKYLLFDFSLANLPWKASYCAWLFSLGIGGRVPSQRATELFSTFALILRGWGLGGRSDPWGWTVLDNYSNTQNFLQISLVYIHLLLCRPKAIMLNMKDKVKPLHVKCQASQQQICLQKVNMCCRSHSCYLH